MSNVDQQIKDLMAQLGNMSYSVPSSYHGYTPQVTAPITGTPVTNLTPWGFTPADFKSLAAAKKKKQSGWHVDFWKMLDDTLGQLGGFVTNTAYNELKNIYDPKKSTWEKVLGSFTNNPIKSLEQGVVNGAKEQWKDWTDGHGSWGDVPLVGFLNGMGQGWKRGSDIMKDVYHVKNNLGVTGGGLAIDIAADPLTWLTGGASLAGKAGDVAKAAKMLDIGKTLGLTKKFKNTDDFINAARDTLKAKYPNMSDSIIEKKLGRISDDINNARNAAYNANINKVGLSIPFSKSHVVLGDMPKFMPTYRTEATLGSQYKHLVDNLMNDVGLKPEQQKAILEHLYGKNKAEDLTKTEFNNLHATITNAAKKLAEHEGSLKDLPDAIIHEVSVLKPRPEIIAPPSLNRVTNALGDGLEHFPPREIDHVLRSAELTKGNKNKGLRDITDFIEKKVDVGNGKTKLQHFLDKHSPFEARTLKTGNKFLDTMAEHIQDANSQKVGERAKYVRGLSKLQKYIKHEKITQDEMKDAIYAVEGKAPASYGKDWVPSERVKGLADLIRPITSQVGRDEVAAGILSKLRGNYFPHVLNKSPEDLAAIQDFIKRHPEHGQLSGLKGTNQFDKTRKSFPTLADAQNYIHKLEKAIQNAPDNATIESLKAQQERVANLFHTDVVTALEKRIQEGVRARAMKAMQGELKKFGMFVTEPKEGQVVGAGMKKLTADEAKKLGLDPKKEHFMNEQVFNGLKKVDDIFTDEGMNKAVRAMNAIADIWRPLVTFYKPSHYRNNIIGNVINNLAAGVHVRDYKLAKKLITGYRKGKLTPEQMKIMDAAYKHNVISGGFLFDGNATYNFDKPWKIEKFAKKVGHNWVVDKPRMAGEFFDDITRLANFVNGMEKMGSAAKGAQQVRKYLFNYNELTKPDKAMRMIVPFWNWIKRNVPLQLETLLENPKFAMNGQRFNDLFNNGQNGQDWQKQTGIHLPFKIDGKEYYTTIPNPANDLQDITEPIRTLLGGLHPLPKSIIELYTNKNLYTQNPISYGSNNVQAKDVPNYLISNLLGGRDAYKLATGKQKLWEFLTTLLNPISRVNTVGVPKGGN